MKLPAPYISYSQYWLYRKDPMEYYEQYYIGRVDEPTPPMILGRVFQEAWCDPKYNYTQALIDEGMAPAARYSRIIKTALEHPRTIKVAKSKTEKRLKVQGMGLKYPILGILDGFDTDRRVILENKMTNNAWDQDRADTDEQLTWYALAVRLKYGWTPKIILQAVNSKNGIPKQYQTKRYVTQMRDLIININSMVDRIAAGDFEQR